MNSLGERTPDVGISGAKLLIGVPISKSVRKIDLLLPGALVMIGLGLFVNPVFAQTEEIETEQHHYLIAASTFIASGIFYSMSGWIRRIRRAFSGEEVQLDPKKMGKSIALGLILGAAAFIWTTYNGDTIAVHTLPEFLQQVTLNTTAILFVDKWLLGRSSKSAKNTEGDINYDVPDIADRPTSTPPGKDQ